MIILSNWHLKKETSRHFLEDTSMSFGGCKNAKLKC
jgi:hypothetical protein